MNLPAGRYALFGKTVVRNYNREERPAECRLSTGEYSKVHVKDTENVIVVQDLLTLTVIKVDRLHG